MSRPHLVPEVDPVNLGTQREGVPRLDQFPPVKKRNWAKECVGLHELVKSECIDARLQQTWTDLSEFDVRCIHRPASLPRPGHQGITCRSLDYGRRNDEVSWGFGPFRRP